MTQLSHSRNSDSVAEARNLFTLERERHAANNDLAEEIRAAARARILGWRIRRALLIAARHRRRD